MRNLVNERRFIVIRRKVMKIWDSKLAIFTRKENIGKFDFLYFYEFATVSYETSHIYRMRHNNRALRLIFYFNEKLKDVG